MLCGKDGKRDSGTKRRIYALVTAYGFPHHGNRSFTFVQDDALPIFLTTGIGP